MKRMRVAHFVSGMLAVACLLMAPAAHALLFTIEVDTAPLIGHPAGPFSLEFQLNDGSGTSDGNNTALIGPFDSTADPRWAHRRSSAARAAT